MIRYNDAKENVTIRLKTKTIEYNSKINNKKLFKLIINGLSAQN